MFSPEALAAINEHHATRQQALARLDAAGFVLTEKRVDATYGDWEMTAVSGRTGLLYEGLRNVETVEAAIRKDRRIKDRRMLLYDGLRDVETVESAIKKDRRYPS